MRLQNQNDDAKVEGLNDEKAPQAAKKNRTVHRPLCLVEKMALKFLYDHYMADPNTIVDQEEEARTQMHWPEQA